MKLYIKNNMKYLKQLFNCIENFLKNTELTVEFKSEIRLTAQLTQLRIQFSVNNLLISILVNSIIYLSYNHHIIKNVKIYKDSSKQSLYIKDDRIKIDDTMNEIKQNLNKKLN